MNREQLLRLPAVVDVPTAGRAYGIGRETAYALARTGQFPVPVLRIGRLLKVRSADLLRDLVPDSSEAAAPTAALAVTDLTTRQGTGSVAR